MRILIPIICGILYRIGGTDQWQWIKWFNQKLWRWLGIGLFTGITFAILKHSWIPLLAIVTYAGAIQAFPYGDKSWIPLSQNWKHFTSGFFYGLASAPILYFWSIPLAIISGGVFYLIEKYKINNPYAELLRGGLGSCLL